MSLERLSFNFEVKVASEDESFFFIEGYAATFGNIDRHDDIIEAGAFRESVAAFRSGALKLSFLWQHDTWQPVGSVTELSEDSIGLKFKAKLPKEDTFVSGRVMPQIRAGGVTTLSIGFIVRDHRWEDDIRLISKIELWEISLATIPANTQAIITGHKSAFQDLAIAPRDCSWDADEAAERVGDREKAYLPFGEEKLLIADVVEGTLTVVPVAVFKAAALVALKAAEEPNAVKHVERYYKKMGFDSPFGKSFRVDDWGVFLGLEKRCQEKLLHGGIRLSGSEAKAFVVFLESKVAPESSEEWGPVLDTLKSMTDP